MRVLDLFSGIGGFSLGLERAGMRTVAFCEIDPYCRAVIAKHWPGVPVYGDIRELTTQALANSNGSGLRRSITEDEKHGSELQPEWPARDDSGKGGVDVICGGFPCQDISFAGKGAGLAGSRSGLWREYHRLIRELRPRYVIVENVAALLSRGLGEVLGDLAQIGYDAEWHCIPASYVGAPHRRDRIWIIAYPNNGSDLHFSGSGGKRIHTHEYMASGSSSGGSEVADANSSGLEGSGPSIGIREEQSALGGASWWSAEPDVDRVAHGVPSRVDRLRALGNAVVPQVVEIIGRAIMRAEA